MTIQHSNDFKLSAVKLYLKFNSIRKVSKLLNCSKSSLQRWIERYFETGNIERKIYKNRITNEILKFIISMIKNNPTITLSKIKKKIIKNHKIEISVSYLFYIGGRGLSFTSFHHLNIPTQLYLTKHSLI